MASCKEALRRFLAPIMAKYCRIIDEGDPNMPVQIHFGGYVYETTLAEFKALDSAHKAAFERQVKASARKANRGLFGATDKAGDE